MAGLLEVTATVTYQIRLSDNLYKEYESGKYDENELIDILDTTLYSQGNITDIDINDSSVYEVD